MQPIKDTIVCMTFIGWADLGSCSSVLIKLDGDFVAQLVGQRNYSIPLLLEVFPLLRENKLPQNSMTSLNLRFYIRGKINRFPFRQLYIWQCFPHVPQIKLLIFHLFFLARLTEQKVFYKNIYI